jgi:hypothetical protein
MGTNSSQIRQDLSEFLSQTSANESHVAQRLSGHHRKKQRRRVQRTSHRKRLKHNVRRHYSNAFAESVDEVIKALLMEVYDWEKMTPKERWEQEQLKELEEMMDVSF